VYFQLTDSIQRRFIRELRFFWSLDPKFKDEIVEHIQGKYSFRERPQTGIVLKNSSGNQTQLAADNFQGHVVSYCTVAAVDNAPGLAIEWVREDAQAIQRNGGYMPSEPGIYYVEITGMTGDPRACTSFEYYIDPLLSIDDETVVQTGPLTFVLQKGRFLDGSLKLYRMSDNGPTGGVLLESPDNYTADPSTGEITLVLPLDDGQFLSADYKSPEDPVGPFTGRPNFANNSAIPGVVLAFGRRVGVGDRQAVMVSRTREISALEYGGRWDLNIDFDVIARDPYDQREILDRTATYIWGVLRSRLSTEGIEILAINLGGETEEIADENGDDYYYNASFSIQVQTDWSLHVPVVARLNRVEPGVNQSVGELAGMTDEEITQVDNNLKLLEDIGAVRYQDSFFNGKEGRPGRPGRPRRFEVLR